MVDVLFLFGLIFIGESCIDANEDELWLKGSIVWGLSLNMCLMPR